jgi:hypothetical protein
MENGGTEGALRGDEPSLNSLKILWLCQESIKTPKLVLEF